MHTSTNYFDTSTSIRVHSLVFVERVSECVPHGVFVAGDDRGVEGPVGGVVAPVPGVKGSQGGQGVSMTARPGARNESSK